MSKKGPYVSISTSLDGMSSPIVNYTPSAPMAISRKSSTPMPFKRIYPPIMANSMPIQKFHHDSSESSDSEDGHGAIFDFTYKPPLSMPKPIKEKKLADSAPSKLEAKEELFEEYSDSEKEHLNLNAKLTPSVPNSKAQSGDDSLFSFEDSEEAAPLLNAFAQFALGPKTQEQIQNENLEILGTRPGAQKRYNPKGY